MSTLLGQPLNALETPQLLIDLDIVDANLQRLFGASQQRGVAVRVHFKSLKCGGLARYIAEHGGRNFLCAKLNEAEVLADAGLTDILIANQIVGPLKLRRLTELARRAQVAVCVDDPQNVDDLGTAAQTAGVTLGVLVEVDIGMGRCGVATAEEALTLAQRIAKRPGLRFLGLQGYDGHLQLLPDAEERRRACLQGLAKLVGARKTIEQAGLPVAVVTGAGTGTWDFEAGYPGVTEIQPGSFVLMDSAYHPIRPEFGCSLSVLTTVISRHASWYVLDAGSKAIARDFGLPLIKNRPQEVVQKLAEEHAVVACDDASVRVGDQREVIPTHCCATMNLHRACIGVRKGRVETLWPIEASGRYY